MDHNNLTHLLKTLVDELPDGKEVDLLKDLVDELKTFLQHIGETDRAIVNQILKEFETHKEIPLFREVGMLLRRFHDQIVLIDEEIPKNLGKFSSEEMNEMSSRLQQIINMTEKAANTTLDRTEEIMEELNQQNDVCQPLISTLISLMEKDKISASTKKTLKKALTQLEGYTSKNDEIQTKLTDILIAQDYQDLTGQVIQKVMNLLKSLESDLSELIKRFGQIYQEVEKSEQIALEGPLGDDDEKKSSQDDVDSLLKEFGF